MKPKITSTETSKICTCNTHQRWDIGQLPEKMSIFSVDVLSQGRVCGKSIRDPSGDTAGTLLIVFLAG